MIKLILSVILIFSFVGCSSKKKNEKYYQTKFCNELNGVMEYRLSDKTRVDCLTDQYAIEVDWAKKWAEAIGQTLYYAHYTEKKAAIALIIKPKDQRFVDRARILSEKFDIKIFIIKK